MKHIFVPIFLSILHSFNCAIISEPRKEAVYSARPNNTPVTRIYVFGKPVYIRQPFVIPQRNVTFAAKSSKFENIRDMEEMLSQPNLFDRRRYRDAYGTKEPSFSIDGAVTNDKQEEEVYSHEKSKYPLKQCYTEKSGFMCCNKKLEKVMEDTVGKLKKNNWKNCNMQTLANNLQNASESAFGTDFETIVGVGDFASKIHFYSDHVCKMEREGRVFLSYATPNRHNNDNYDPYVSQ